MNETFYLPPEACDRSNVAHVSLDSRSRCCFGSELDSMQGRTRNMHVKADTQYTSMVGTCPNPRFQNERTSLRTAVVNSCGSAACLRCWPMGDSGVFKVGMLFVVKRRCSWPRTSPVAGAAAWEPKVLRNGEVRPRAANDDCSSRGERRPPRSPILDGKAMFY